MSVVASGDANNTLRVCFFIPDFGYGGAQKQCILLLNELQRVDDVELTLVRFRRGEQDHLLNTHRLRVEYVNVRSNFDIRAVLAVSRLVYRTRSDVIVSWIRVCDVYAFFVRMLCPRLKWVMTQRNSRHADSLLFRLRDRLGRRADAIVANSPGGVEWWKQRKPYGSIHLVDNISVPVVATTTGGRAKRLLYVGRLESQKNVLVMARAFAIVAKSCPEVEIAICGDGRLREKLEQIVVEAGVADRVNFLGFRKDATEWMACSKVLVSLSEHEGMPNVLMEGVTSGCTIVASAIREHVDFLGRSYPYLVDEYDDADAAANVILAALGDPSDARYLHMARQRLALMEPSAVAARYVEVFRIAATPAANRTARA